MKKRVRLNAKQGSIKSPEWMLDVTIDIESDSPMSENEYSAIMVSQILSFEEAMRNADKKLINDKE